MAGSHEVRGSSPLSSTPSPALQPGCHELRNHFGFYRRALGHVEACRERDPEARALDEVTAHLRELLTLRRSAPDAVAGPPDR